MSKPKFQIGDEVWRASTQTRPVKFTCLECAGKGYLTVILGDDTRVTIACDCCRRGYEGSNGYHDQYEHFEVVEQGRVSGVEVSEDTFEYRVPAGGCSSWCVKESELFSDEASAQVRAGELSKERTQTAANLPCLKHKGDRSWSWNVTYYRRSIREAQRQIEQHTASLNYALTRVKDKQ